MSRMGIFWEVCDAPFCNKTKTFSGVRLNRDQEYLVLKVEGWTTENGDWFCRECSKEIATHVVVDELPESR